MLPLQGSICMGVDQRNHRFAPELPPGRGRTVGSDRWVGITQSEDQVANRAKLSIDTSDLLGAFIPPHKTRRAFFRPANKPWDAAQHERIKTMGRRFSRTHAAGAPTPGVL